MWQWGLGRQYVNAIREDGKRARITVHELLGISPDEAERGRHKGWLHITPKHIADWLARQGE